MPVAKANRRSGSGIPYWVTRPDYIVECLTCGWTAYEHNAKMLAARHARAHCHEVRVEESRAIYYCGNELTDA